MDGGAAAAGRPGQLAGTGRGSHSRRFANLTRQIIFFYIGMSAFLIMRVRGSMLFPENIYSVTQKNVFINKPDFSMRKVLIAVLLVDDF